MNTVTTTKEFTKKWRYLQKSGKKFNFSILADAVMVIGAVLFENFCKEDKEKWF